MKSVRAKTSSIGFFIGALILLCAWAIQAFDKQHAARDDRISVLIIFLCSVGYLQLGVLPFQLLEPLSIRQGGIAPRIRLGLGPLDPRAQRLGRAADLPGNRLHRRPS